MIRKDREIADADEILNVLRKCNTISVGFQGMEYPYVVPVSFGVVRNDNSLIIYFHCAKRGYKIDMIESNPKVCVQGHVFHKVEPTKSGITTRYESVIGFGTVEKVDGDEIVTGLRSIIEHYDYPEYAIAECKALQMTAVYKIKMDMMTGKSNLPEQPQIYT